MTPARERLSNLVGEVHAQQIASVYPAINEIDWHTTELGRRTIRGTLQDLAAENAKEIAVLGRIRSAPSFAPLLKAYHRFRRDLNKFDYNPTHIETRLWELLTAHAGVMNAKSGRAQTLKRLAFAVFSETGLPRRALNGFRGSDGIDWEKL